MLATRISSKRGFTLMELLVAMAITTIIVTVLISVTSIALDTWNRSRSELRASRQAKQMIDTMARDFEGLVIRRSTPHEWLTANHGWHKENEPFGTTPIGDPLPSTNASKLIFFTTATDRYNGEIGTTNDIGGEVSCVAYKLDYKDPISPTGSTFKTFVLNRLLVNPDDTLNDLLGKANLETAFATHDSKLSNQENFLCENVFQFSVTFHVQITRANGTSVTVPIALGSASGARTTQSFKVKGTEIVCDATAGTSGGTTVTDAEIKAGRVTAVELSLTILTDFAIDQLKSRSFNDTQKADFLAKHSYQYIKLVQVPGT
jgi:prepilin-type N-terminal cleavage/methylation domain-containing protein